ncbi:PREDICTED: dual serine/threonine and tyrosine protein kinase-like [Branchiostoma belcheri]|uniref:Dual serine/threonine and tyrosine protein kinase-like n=1 Tax=Branchiostoma belcheri TaxID=7741 RepID=A0A6P5A9U3_BRABE|nr:PREDICTED: dual serine/threonine and tyrosine protein kinase-like [Branchiostoma belcheri]
MAEKKAISTEEEIDQMNFGELYWLLQEDGTTKDDMVKLSSEEAARAEVKKRIRDIRAAAATSRRPGQAADKLREIKEAHNAKRQRLADCCKDITAYLPKLDERVKDKLKIQFGREVEDISKDVQSHLDKDECPILVAGETSSGKSTILNLLLGEDILPVAHSSSTSTICEVKYGENRRAVVHLRKANKQGERHITIPLDGTELKSYMHVKGASRDILPPAQWIEIFLPHPLLQGGIVLVDSPGVGENDKMDKVVADYMPKAFALLYIINSSNAGGVQQDRLGRLLQLYKKNNADDFDPESAMFVCNKWDFVPPEEQDELKTETLRKLSAMWDGLEESQVFFVSTKKAVRFRVIFSEDFCKVLDGLDFLMSKSLDIKLETQYRLLSRLLSEALVHIKVQLTVTHQHLTEGDKFRKCDEAKQHLQSFQGSYKQSTEKLNNELRENVETTKSILSDLVKKGGLKKEVMEVQKLHLSLPDGSITTRDQDRELVKRGEDFSMLKDLYEALPGILAHYDSFERSVKPKEMLDSFKRKLKEVANSLEKAQQHVMEIITGSSLPVSRMQVRDFLSQPNAFIRGLRKTFLLWSGRLSAAHAYAYVRKWKASSSTVSILKNYWKQAPEGTPLVDLLMQALSSKDELITELADRQMQPQRDLMALLEDDFKKMKDIMEQTVDQTFKDTRSNEIIKQTYEPQSEGINSFLGQLAMFHLTEMRKYEYPLDSITGWTDPRNKIGGGSFGEVYRVQVPWKGAETPAALKLGLMPYDIITAETAWDFLQEEETIRRLTGDHIVEYYGTAFKRIKAGLRLGLVMELCDGTLESRIIGQKNRNPAWWGSYPEKQAAAFSYTKDKAIQLCEGLKQIHDAGYIHRDLKLTNILVTKYGTVKLADVGQTKREDKITGTIAGTAIYAAPEVKEQKVYDKSADIYSLGLILFEMWYGRTLYGHQDITYIKQMEEDRKEGKDIRMPQWQGTVPPIPEWNRLIQDCLKKDPKERPEIQECLDRMKAMKLEQTKK